MDSWMNYENQFATMTLSKCNVLYIIWSQYIHFSLTGYWIWNDVYSFFFFSSYFYYKKALKFIYFSFMDDLNYEFLTSQPLHLRRLAVI